MVCCDGAVRMVCCDGACARFTGICVLASQYFAKCGKAACSVATFSESCAALLTAHDLAKCSID